MKAFLFTLGAVLLGIWAWSKLTAKAPAGAGAKAAIDTSAPFQGPEIDPVSGAYTPPGDKPGTVGFPQDGLNGGYNVPSAEVTKL